MTAGRAPEPAPGAATAGGLPRRIVCAGECMVEMAPTDLPGCFGMGFAGDTFNTAWYLRRALPPDWSVDYLSAIGTDAVSDRMAAFVAQAGIGTAHLARLPERSVGLYLIDLVEGERSFSYWRGQSAARLLARDAARLDAAFAGAGLVYFSGITLAILAPEDRARFLAALARARRAGARIAFDPNLRPRLWADPAEMCAAVLQAAALSDIVLPSHEDEATHFGDADCEATARRYAEAGARLVVVKNGGGTLLTLSDEGLARHAPAHAPRILDTTAAGDSFNAAFLAAHLGGADLAEAVARGAATAAHVIGHRGALVA